MKDIEKEIAMLEKLLKKQKISITELKRLLQLYKSAITYYSIRNPTRKNEFNSRYKYALESPYVIQLMKRSTARFFLYKTQ